jgi:DNA-directed RNA polymerase specialized sigma24 family protein
MMSNDTISDIDLALLRSNVKYREEVCTKIYQSVAIKNGIRNFILGKGGDKEEVDEIFQESIIRFFRALMQSDFVLQTQVDKYLFGIARNVFLSKTNKNEIKTVQIQHEDIPDIPTEQYKDLTKILSNILQFTTDTCRQVLLYWSNNYRMLDIANFMGYQSEMMARKKKHECLQKLTAYLKKNPEITYKILNDE